MSDYYSSRLIRDSPQKYNPKVDERKLQPHTDWAQLVRYQQNMAEKMIQKEKELKDLQRQELNGVLNSLVNDKNNQRMRELKQKEEEYYEMVKAKQAFDEYLNQVKEEKMRLQKGLANEYDREKQEKNYDNQRKLHQEQQVEQRIVNDALTSLEHERMMNEKKRSDYQQTMEQMLQEREVQKRMEHEQMARNRQDHNRLMEENAYLLDLKEKNYKMYYELLQKRQGGRQQLYDATTGFNERARNRTLDAFVEKGVEETRRKNEEEEYRRQKYRQDQMADVNQNLKSKIRAHEEERLNEKLSYYQKVEDLRRKNEELNFEKEEMKKTIFNQKTDYRSILEQQMREAEMNKRRQQAEMLEYEKKMHLTNFEGFIPGIRNSKADELISPHMKTSKTFASIRPQMDLSPLDTSSGANISGQTFRSPMPVESKSPKMNYSSMNGIFNDGVKSPMSGMNSPANITPKNERYNPITNPVANNVQNPYLVKDIQNGGFLRRNYLAVLADKNLLGHAH